MAEKKYLAVIGVPSIKKYVFGTERLKEIRGASALLDQLNRLETERFLFRNANISKQDIVFLGGGAGQFFIVGDEQFAKKQMRGLERLYSEKTNGGIRLTWGFAEYDGTDYQRIRKTAEVQAESKRDEFPIIEEAHMHSGFAAECASCAKMASSLVTTDDSPQPVCGVCLEKLRFERQIKRPDSEKGAWNEFLDYLKTKSAETARPETFEAIGELCSAKRDYTAVVYADGNNMGKTIEEIDDSDSFRFFSETIEGAIKRACHEALHEIFFTREKSGTLPADILLLGGDDLVLYMTAESALPFAVLVARKFNEITKRRFRSEYRFREKLGERGLTISLGIAYGKSHTPFSIMLNQASELLASAKIAGSQDENSGPYYSPSYIDFHLSTAFNRIDVADCRKNHLEFGRRNTGKKIRLWQKPYSLEDAEALLLHARNLKEKGIPGTRLKRFGYAPTLGKMNGTVECLMLYARTPKGEKRRAILEALERFGCVPNMPWNETNDDYDSTVLVDLMEIADLCEKNDGARHAP